MATLPAGAAGRARAHRSTPVSELPEPPAHGPRPLVPGQPTGRCTGRPPGSAAVGTSPNRRALCAALPEVALCAEATLTGHSPVPARRAARRGATRAAGRAGGRRRCPVAGAAGRARAPTPPQRRARHGGGAARCRRRRPRTGGTAATAPAGGAAAATAPVRPVLGEPGLAAAVAGGSELAGDVGSGAVDLPLSEGGPLDGQVEHLPVVVLLAGVVARRPARARRHVAPVVWDVQPPALPGTCPTARGQLPGPAQRQMPQLPRLLLPRSRGSWAGRCPRIN